MTQTLRAKFEGEMGRRFRRIKGLINEALVANDVLGLKVHRAPPTRAFDFPRSADKVAAFMAWLRDEQQAEILELRRGAPVSRSAENVWANLYVETAYQKGIALAGQKLRGAGVKVDERWINAAFNRPVHADRLGLIFTRTFSELRGITEEMDRQISRVLAQGMAEGRGVRDIARALNDRVDKIGRTRARMLARTEIVRSHNEASLNAYQEAGIEGVDVEAEFLTASDPCPECAALAAGGPYSIDEARGLIPVHPNCRCSWTPRVVNGTGIELR